MVHRVVNRRRGVGELVMMRVHWRGGWRRRRWNAIPILVPISLGTVVGPVSHAPGRVVPIISLNLGHAGRRSRGHRSHPIPIVVAVVVPDLSFDIWDGPICVFQVVVRSNRARSNRGRGRISLGGFGRFPLRKPVAPVPALLRLRYHRGHARL